jgi:hypothetical protein
MENGHDDEQGAAGAASTSGDKRCAWCGARNPAGAERCQQCNAAFPNPEVDAALQRDSEERIAEALDVLASQKRRRPWRGR